VLPSLGEQGGVHLVIEEAVHFDKMAAEGAGIPAKAFDQLLHGSPPAKMKQVQTRGPVE